MVDHSPQHGQAPGREGVKQAFARTRAAAPNAEATIEDIAAEADRVAVRLVVRGTQRTTQQTAPPTGNSFTMAGLSIFRIADARIVEMRHQFDLL